MASYGDFSSLLQLGVGVGIGLSVFRAPVDLRVGRIAKKLEGEILALRGAATEFGKAKRRDMQDLNVSFIATQVRLEQIQKPFMIVAVILAAANLAGLYIATIDKDRPAEIIDLVVLTFISIVGYLLLIVGLEILARIKLNIISKTLTDIQTRRI